MPPERSQPIHVAQSGRRVHKPTASRPQYHRITWTDPATGKRKQASERTAKQARKRGDELYLDASDVDLDRCLTQVERALGVTRRSGREVVKPKDCKSRTTFVPEALRATLWRLIERRTVRDGPHATLWVAPMGGLETRNSLREKRFNPVARDAQWPVDEQGAWKWAWHALRHDPA